MTAGLLILLFTGFQLWGTGLAEARAQSALDAEFEGRLQLFRQLSHPDGPTPDDEPPTDAEPPEAPLPLTVDQIPNFGDAAGRIVIPAIGVNKTIIHGVTRDDLQRGPGHYPTSALPGQPGNAAIAGHRTTHGAPFFDLDQLEPGDEIVLETLQGRFTYLVESHDNGSGNDVGHFIVPPTATHVLNDQGDNRLTLTACHPRYSAAQRIIVTATLSSTPAPSSPVPARVDPRSDTAGAGTEVGDATGTDDPVLDQSSQSSPVPADETRSVDTVSETGDGGDDSLGWRPEYAPPTALWAGITALIAFGAWLIGRRWRTWPVYVLAAGPLVGSLFMCFTHLDKFLPAV